jgi:hypothetical protein
MTQLWRANQRFEMADEVGKPMEVACVSRETHEVTARKTLGRRCGGQQEGLRRKAREGSWP